MVEDKHRGVMSGHAALPWVWDPGQVYHPGPRPSPGVYLVKHTSVVLIVKGMLWKNLVYYYWGIICYIKHLYIMQAFDVAD